MPPPHTPDLDKPKLYTTPASKPLSQLLPLPTEAMPPHYQYFSQTQNVGGLPPTPIATPAQDTLADSFDDEHNAHHEQTVNPSIASLTPGQSQTTDFIPNWQATAHGSITNASDASSRRLSSSSDTSIPSTDRESHDEAQICLDQESHLPLPQSTVKQADAMHATVSSSKRKAWWADHWHGKARTVEHYERFRRPASSSQGNGGPQSAGKHDVAPKPVNLAGKVSTDKWWPTAAEGWERYRWLLRGEAEHHFRVQSEAAQNYRRQQSALAGEPESPKPIRKSKPATRPKTPKTTQKSNPEHDQSEERSLRSAAPLTEAALSHSHVSNDNAPSDSEYDEAASSTESDYADRHHLEKTRKLPTKTRPVTGEQNAPSNGSLVRKTLMAGAKRKREGDEPGGLPNGSVTKKKKTGVRGTKGAGEAKPKSPKEKKLGEIKNWLHSKTQKMHPNKKPGEALTPDHKSDYEALNFVRLPDMGTKIDKVSLAFVDEKLGPKGVYEAGNPTGLHPQELRLARLLNVTADQYRCQKRRIFAARAVFERIHEHEGLASSWGRTQTQLVGSIDANKLSFFYEAFDKWGWFDTIREKWDEEYLDWIANDFTTRVQK